MKFACKCGNVIYDTTDLLPYKAWFIPDEDTNRASEDLMAELAAYIEARERGEEQAYWQKHRRWMLHDQSSTLKDKLHQAFGGFPIRVGRAMYECGGCGRIWMYARPTGPELVSYMPESSERGMLRHQGADATLDA